MLLYVFLSLCAPFWASAQTAPGTPADGQPFVLVLVLDQTGSVGSEAARQALEVIDLYGSQISKIGLVAFGDTARSLVGSNVPTASNYGLTTTISEATDILEDAVYENSGPFFFDGGGDTPENGVDALDLALDIVEQSAGSQRRFIYFLTDASFDHQLNTPASVRPRFQQAVTAVWLNSVTGPSNLDSTYTTAFPADGVHVFHAPIWLHAATNANVRIRESGNIIPSTVHLEPGTYTFTAELTQPFLETYNYGLSYAWTCQYVDNSSGHITGSAVDSYISIDNQNGGRTAVITVAQAGVYGIHVAASCTGLPTFARATDFAINIGAISTTFTANGAAIPPSSGPSLVYSSYLWSTTLAATIDPSLGSGFTYTWTCVDAVDALTQSSLPTSALNIVSSGSSATFSTSTYGTYTVRFEAARTVGNYARKTQFIKLTLGHPPIERISDPAGVGKITVPALSDSYLSPIYHRAAIADGAALSASGSTISIETQGALAANALVNSPGVQNETYYLHIRSGARRGARFDITANTASTGPSGAALTTLTVALAGDTLSGITPGDQIQIIPHWTLATLLPAGQGFPSSTGFIGSQITGYVIIPNADSAGINLPTSSYYYYNGTANGGPGWRKSGATLTTLFNHLALPPHRPLTIRNQTSNAISLFNAGFLPSGGHYVNVRTLAANTAQDNPVTLQSFHSTYLGHLGLPAAGVFESTTTTTPADLLLVYNGTTGGYNKTPDQYFYYSGYIYGPPGWKKVGAAFSASYDYSVQISSFHGLVIRKAAKPAPAQAAWKSVPESVKYYANDPVAPFTFAVNNTGGYTPPVTLSWLAATGLTYQVESSADMFTWTVVGAPVVGNNTQASRTFYSNDRFFRISAGGVRRDLVSGAASPSWNFGTSRVDLPFNLKLAANGLPNHSVGSAVITPDGCIVLSNTGDYGVETQYTAETVYGIFDWCAMVEGNHTWSEGGYTVPMLAPLRVTNTLGTTGITYRQATVNGFPAFAVNWIGTGSGAQTNKFQAVIIDRTDIGGAANGNFDVEFNYDQVQYPGQSGLCDRNWAFHGFKNNRDPWATLDSASTGLRYTFRATQSRSFRSPAFPGRYVFEYRDGYLQNPDPIMRPQIYVETPVLDSGYMTVDYDYCTENQSNVLASVTIKGTKTITLGAWANIWLSDYGYATTDPEWYCYNMLTDAVTGPFYMDPNTGSCTITVPDYGPYEISTMIGHPAGEGFYSPYYNAGQYMPEISPIDGMTYIGVNFVP
jgi:uncharacterized protein (TIGR02597 family)